MTQVLPSKYAGDVTPKEAWDILENDDKSILIDCRTDAEWSYVGAPNLSQISKKPIKISWKVFPEMNINPEFQPPRLAIKTLTIYWKDLKVIRMTKVTVVDWAVGGSIAYRGNRVSLFTLPVC